jgi:hypothetical protein
MKQRYLLLLFFFLIGAAKAQTLQEWTEQKKTKTRYLLEQIAALSVYIESAGKGYGIVKAGLATLHDIKSGDFKLNQEHFNARALVNPNIKSFSKVAAIIQLQARMMKAIKTTRKNLKEDNGIHKEELDYYASVTSHLIDACADNLDMLIQLVTDSYYALSDAERLKRMDNLYEDLLEQSAFLQSLHKRMKTLALQRIKAQSDVLATDKMYYVK